MVHLIFFLIQLLFLVVAAHFRVFAWPGYNVFFILGWFISAGFYMIYTLLALIRSEWKFAGLYALFIFLIMSIPIKISFSYYNIFIHVAVISLFALFFWQWRQGLPHPYFKLFTALVFSVSLVLLFTPDQFARKHLFSFLDTRFYEDGPISWKDFNKVDSIHDGFDADIRSVISVRTNRVGNYISALVSAQMLKDESHYVSSSASDDLLTHEYYHFKITEMTTRLLQKQIDRQHFVDAETTSRVVDIFTTLLDSLQDRYDRSTAHGLNRFKQKEWQAHIDYILDGKPIAKALRTLYRKKTYDDGEYALLQSRPDSILNGMCRWYSREDKLLSEVPYINGYKHGVCLYYDAGKVWREVKYDFDSLIYRKDFDDDGTLIMLEPFIDTVSLSYTWKICHQNRDYLLKGVNDTIQIDLTGAPRKNMVVRSKGYSDLYRFDGNKYRLKQDKRDTVIAIFFYLDKTPSDTFPLVLKDSLIIPIKRNKKI